MRQENRFSSRFCRSLCWDTGWYSEPGRKQPVPAGQVGVVQIGEKFIGLSFTQRPRILDVDGGVQSIQRGIVAAKEGIPFPFVHQFAVDGIKRRVPKRTVLIEERAALSFRFLFLPGSEPGGGSFHTHRWSAQAFHIAGTAVGIHEIIGSLIYLIINGNSKILLREDGVFLLDGDGGIFLTGIVQVAVGQGIILSRICRSMLWLGTFRKAFR